MSDAMRQVLVRMPPDLLKALQADAAEHDRTVAATVRRAVREYLGAVDFGSSQ